MKSPKYLLVRVARFIQTVFIGLFLIFVGRFDSVSADGVPDLVVEKSHVGDFTQGDVGRTYTIVVTNIGDTPTDGSTITVTDTLPAGLTATGIGGLGWNCTLATLTCTRNDVLDSSESFPDIVLTVNVGLNTLEEIINQVSVSGGGETDIDNSTDSDVTTVVSVTDLIITDVTISPAEPEPYSAFQVYVTVKNQGGKDTESIAYRDVYIDRDPSLMIDPETGCPTQTGDDFRGELNDGVPGGGTDTKPVWTDGADNMGLGPGIHQLWIYVDATCINEEVNEGNNVYGPIPISIAGEPLPSSWAGGITVQSSKEVVTVGRPHVGTQAMTYNGFSDGSTTMYVPMLFKRIWDGYDAALYVQNVDPSNSADITIKYYDVNGNLNCTKTDTISAQSSKGYWIPLETCLPASWVGGVVITSTHNIVAVGRPHIGAEVTTYNGFASGGTTMYVPMLFKKAFGSYDSALYVQNVDAVETASITIKYYDSAGNLSCTRNDTISPLSSKGYWVPSETCLPDGWVGGVVVTSDRDIVAVGRPHVGNQITTYNGFASGSTTMYVPMLFKKAFGSYDSALYVQNVDAVETASITIKYYDSAGNLSCTRNDTISPLSSKGYWVPSETCLPDGWVGGVVVTSDRDIVAVGRPHLGTEVMTYNGFEAGKLANYVPMLFKNMWKTYNAAFYLQNVDEIEPALVTIRFYDTSGSLTCTRQDVIPALASLGYWLPTLTCKP